jgi:excisionase family DNA binding protein
MSTDPQESARMLAGSTGGTMTPNGIPVLLVKARDAAAMLGIGERTLWSLTKRGAVPSRRIGRAVRYPVAELRAWLDAGCPTEPGAAEGVRAAMRMGGQP